MIDQDKFGRKIYYKTFNILFKNGEKLKSVGFKESKTKPNLFYFKRNEIVFFADMRGTDEVPIWEDTSPLIYWKIEDDTLLQWKSNRIIVEFLRKIKNGGVDYRFSFYHHEHYTEDGYSHDSYEEDGYCKFCGKDFLDNGLYCSDDCKILARKKELTNMLNSSSSCEVCKIKILDIYDKDRSKKIKNEIKEVLGVECATKKLEHHTSYEEDETIDVCLKCHAKIHHSKDPKYDEYRPKSKRPEKEKNNYYGVCIKCGNKSIRYTDDPKNCICYKCRQSCKECGNITTAMSGICLNCQWKIRRLARPATGMFSISPERQRYNFISAYNLKHEV